MKINWNKLWNPNNIDFKAMKSMGPDELKKYVKNVRRDELNKAWINWTFMLNYLCFTGYWQYILTFWLTRG